MECKQIITNKLLELTERTKVLTLEREKLIAQVQSIEVRLTQLAGAIFEFNDVLNDIEGEEYENGNT